MRDKVFTNHIIPLDHRELKIGFFFFLSSFNSACVTESTSGLELASDLKFTCIPDLGKKMTGLD